MEDFVGLKFNCLHGLLMAYDDEIWRKC